MTTSGDNTFPHDWSTLPQSRNRSYVNAAPSGSVETRPPQLGSALYAKLLAQGLSYFFPSAQIEAKGRTNVTGMALKCDCEPNKEDGHNLTVEWLGYRYALRNPKRPFTIDEKKLIHAVGRVLSVRYEALYNTDLAVKNFHLFRGLPEDRHVSAFLDASPYASLETLTIRRDRIADAIGALRITSLMTHENLRVSTGVLLVGETSRAAGSSAGAGDALRYSPTLASIPAFLRLCDGMRTVALADAQGRWIDIVDLAQWADFAGGGALPLPSPVAYTAHCLATLLTPNLCLVLTLNGEIKAFADGVQVFSFLNGRWRLADMKWKYRRWLKAVSDEKLAKRILQAGLDMAESRRGGLFVILDDTSSASRLVAPDALLDGGETPPSSDRNGDSNRSLYYLLRSKRINYLAPSVLRTLASIDGGTILDTEGNLLAFGAILHHHHDGYTGDRRLSGGGRSVAALAASRFGKALKISEDGIISFFEAGQLVWEI